MAVSTPAVPASGTAVQNTTGQNVSVTLSGFTLTAVSINGAQAGTANGSYALPPGGSISITYTVAGTWSWANPLDEAGAPQAGAEQTSPPNEMTDMPYPAHGESGEPGLGEAVSN